MIIPKTYKTNLKTGSIIKKERISVCCDKCATIWQTSYDSYCHNKSSIDLCRACRQRKFPLFKIKCDNCGIELERSKRDVKKHVFCSILCRDQFRLKQYSHLFVSFSKNPDEVAYLIGLILGDGHIKKKCKHTSRVSIAFNASDHIALDIAKNIFKKLEINFFIEPKIKSNCVTLGFALPDNLLEQYNMKYAGNKYKNQPCPVEDVVHNINFAIGLLNSDGHYSHRKRGSAIVFTNTVSSIISAIKKCYEFNSINFKQYSHTHKNANWRVAMLVYVMRKEWIDFLRRQKYSKWTV